MKTDRLKKKFTGIYGAGREPVIYRAPGRVNLIGEHTDYNDGLVLPIAIDLSTYGIFRPTNEDKIRVYSENLDKFEEIELANLSRRSDNWTDYVRGVLSGLESRSETISGFDLYLSSEIPVGSGLSSSAALEVVTAVGAIETLNLDEIEDLDLIKLCQKAENDFVGANTGIMDQYASYLGREGAGLLIDTSEPSHTFVDLGMEGYELLVVDTTVSHTHGNNEYNRRRRDCERAVNAINESTAGEEFKSLSDISSEELDDILLQLEEKLARRTEHVVRENERVEKAAGFFQEGRIEEVGELFFASHASLRDLYEVSSPELDFLIEFARAEGIPGARMTGGGFGGSTIHLVPEDQTTDYLKRAVREFEDEFGITPDGFSVSPSDGAKFQNPVDPS